MNIMSDLVTQNIKGIPETDLPAQHVQGGPGIKRTYMVTQHKKVGPGNTTYKGDV
jgi:hypothetical protein